MEYLSRTMKRWLGTLYRVNCPVLDVPKGTGDALVRRGLAEEPLGVDFSGKNTKLAYRITPKGRRWWRDYGTP